MARGGAHLASQIVGGPCPTGEGAAADHTDASWEGGAIEGREGEVGHYHDVRGDGFVSGDGRAVRHRPIRRSGASLMRGERVGADREAKAVPRNIDGVRDLVVNKVELTRGRLLPIACAAGYRGQRSQLQASGSRGEGGLASSCGCFARGCIRPASIW